jgi:hypothetical protein
VNGAGSALHLARRFVGSLRPGPPAPTDEAWAEAHLLAGEVALWRRMANPDRRHAVGVGRNVVAELGPATGRPVVAAALLHDVGKVVSAYRTPARVVATVVWAVVDDGLADRWLERRRPWRRLAQYRRHPQLGAELIRQAGGDPLTVAWAAEHHLPPDRWTLPPTVAAVRKACDDD